MTRVIRPIGKVSSALKRHGYRQQAAIFIDGQQVPHVSILSKRIGDKVKFEGHWIDANGELHKTNAFIDAKKAAGAILAKRDAMKLTAELAASMPAKPAAKPTAKDQRAQRRRKHTSEIDCPGCGTRHSDDEMCPE